MMTEHPSRLSEQLLAVARSRLSDTTIKNEANLRRATSDLYYVMFHAVCEAMVEPLGSQPESPRFKEIFRRAYRQTRHIHAEKRCAAYAKESSATSELQLFARHFIAMKNKRELADYDPLEQLSVSSVRKDLEITETRLRSFWHLPSFERTAFAFDLGLKAMQDGPSAG